MAYLTMPKTPPTTIISVFFVPSVISVIQNTTTLGVFASWRSNNRLGTLGVLVVQNNKLARIMLPHTYWLLFTIGPWKGDIPQCNANP
jgi:hypothetical protein